MYMNPQERILSRTLPQPPPTALKHPRGPGPTSLCHKSNIKLIFMFQNTTKQKHVRKIKMYRLSGAPSPCGTKNIPSSKCYEYPIIIFKPSRTSSHHDAQTYHHERVKKTHEKQTKTYSSSKCSEYLIIVFKPL